MQEEKIFILGLGAAKCGTTWLFDYLERNPAARFGIEKEYSVLNAHFSELCSGYNERRLTKLSEHKAGRNSKEEWASRLKMLVEFTSDLELYFDHFADLIKNEEGTVFTGDFTPTNCVLDTDALRMVDSEFARRGIKVKAIQLVRDPVERIISNARFIIRLRESRRALGFEEIPIINEILNNRNLDFRSDYKTTRENAKEVFGDRFFESFYEELFDAQKLSELSDFLGVPFTTPDFDNQVNVSKIEYDLPVGIKNEISKKLASQYEYYFKEFGEAKVKSLWPNYFDPKVDKEPSTLHLAEEIFTESQKLAGNSLRELNKIQQERDKAVNQNRKILRYPWKFIREFIHRGNT